MKNLRVPSSGTTLRRPGAQGRRPRRDPDPIRLQAPSLPQRTQNVSPHVDDLLSGMGRRHGNP